MITKISPIYKSLYHGLRITKSTRIDEKPHINQRTHGDPQPTSQRLRLQRGSRLP